MFKFLLIFSFFFWSCSQLEIPSVLPSHMNNGVLEKQDHGMSIKIEMSPRLSILGENRLFIILKDSAGLPVEDAHLNISSTSTIPGMKIERAEIYHGPQGIYESKLHFLSVGQWKITLRIHLFGKKEIEEVVLFDVIGHASIFQPKIEVKAPSCLPATLFYVI